VRSGWRVRRSRARRDSSPQVSPRVHVDGQNQSACFSGKTQQIQGSVRAVRAVHPKNRHRGGSAPHELLLPNAFDAACGTLTREKNHEDYEDYEDWINKFKGFSSPHASPRSPRAPGEPAQKVPSWTDDRAWIREIRHAPDEASKLAILAAWVTAAGGETMGRTTLLPALRPHRDRRLAEVELRRICEQFGLAALEDET
jgi:hypothetical protein